MASSFQTPIVLAAAALLGSSSAAHAFDQGATQGGNTSAQPTAAPTEQAPASPKPQGTAPATPQAPAQTPASPQASAQPQAPAQVQAPASSQAPAPAQAPQQAPEAAPATAPETPAIPPNLTQSASPKAASAPAQAPKAQQDPSVSPDELRKRVLGSYYRPAHDPIRFQGTVRAGIYGGGRSNRTDGGRGMGLELESGFTKNNFGLSLALGAQFGRYHLVPLAALPHHPEVSTMARPKHPGYKTPVSLSTGIRAGIGRLALQDTGFIDPRLGYGFNWTPVQRISGHRPKKIAVSHGPSLRIDAGFMSMAPGKQRDFRRVFGATLGWDMRVGGLNTKLPTAHFIFLGIFGQMN